MSSIPCSLTETSLNSKSSNTLPIKEVLQSVSFPTSNSDSLSDSEPQEFSHLEAFDATDTEQCASSYTPEIRESNSFFHSGESQVWLAVYVTLAQVSLALVVLILHGFFKLLEEYLRPIVWASLCSIPLRGIQDILLESLSEPLKAGLTDAIMAVPVAIARACLGTVIYKHKRLHLEMNNAMEIIMDWYTSECCEKILQQIDNFASDYNLSELVEAIKQFVITDGSAYLVIYIEQSIVSCASGLVQFLIKSTVFFWVLYNLLTSESGGVTEQVMEAIPISKPIKKKCINSLNNVIAGVLLATADTAFFQGCFTCRLFSTHFVYVSTLVAFLSPLLPIFPPWLATLVGGVELVLDGSYVFSIGFCITHTAVMDYAASEIAVCVPGYSTYLTGVSIL